MALVKTAARGHRVRVQDVMDGGLVTYQARCRTSGCAWASVWFSGHADAVAEAQEHLRVTGSAPGMVLCTDLVALARAARLSAGGHRFQVQCESDYDADGAWVSYQALCLETDCEWASIGAGSRAAAVADAHGHLAATRPQAPPPVRCAGQLALDGGEVA